MTGLEPRGAVEITLGSEALERFTIEAGLAADDTGAAVPGARVVTSFNTTLSLFSTLVDRTVAGQPLAVPMAPDDGGLKDTVGRFVRDAGLKPVDAGPLARARQREALGLLHMVVQETLGTNLASAVKFLQ